MKLYVAAALLCVIAVCDGRTLRDKLMYPWGRLEGDKHGYKDWIVAFNNTENVRYFRNLYSSVTLCPGGRIGFGSIRNFRCGVDGSQRGDFMLESIGFPPVYWDNIALFGVTHNLGTEDSSPKTVYRDYYYFYHHHYSEGYTYDDYDELLKVETLWYRTTKEESLLRKASNDVQRYFPGCHQNFKPKELLIATWSGANDVDFCEAHYIDEPICTCMTESPFIEFQLSDLHLDTSYLFCRCLHEDHFPLRYCTCYAKENGFGFYYYLEERDPWCLCFEDYYDENYCDCKIDGVCSDMDKRDLLSVKRDVKQETNSYQIVLMTDGRQTYAMFNYLDIKWIYANTFGSFVDYQDAYQESLRIYAEVGFEQGNGPSYHHPYSTSDDLYKLVNETNTGMPGRWMYKISGRKVIAPGCVKLPFDSTT